MAFVSRSQPWVNKEQAGGTSVLNAIDAEDMNRLEGNDADLHTRMQFVEAGNATAYPRANSVGDSEVAVGAAISLDKTADSVNRLAMTPAERSKLSTLQLGGIVSGYIPAGNASASVVHSLGTKDLVFEVLEETTGAYPLVAPVAVDVNTTRFDFAAAPLTNQYRYTIVSKSAILAAPQVRDIPVVIPYATSVTMNAKAGNALVMTLTGNLTLNEPANGADGQWLHLRAIASGAQRVITFGPALKRPTSIANTLTVPSGQRATVGLYHEAAYGWTVTTAFAA